MKTQTKIEPKLVLSAAALLSLAKLPHVNLASNAKAQALRDDLTVGNHSGEVIVRLVYDITKGEDYTGQVANSVPWKDIACALFARVNEATREAVVRDLLKPAEGGGFEFNDDKASPEAVEVIARLMGQTEKTQNGKITGSAVLLPIEG